MLFIPLYFLLKTGLVLSRQPKREVATAPVQAPAVEPLSVEKLDLAGSFYAPVEEAGSVAKPDDSGAREFIAAQNVFNSGNYAEAAALFRDLSARQNEALLGLGLSLYMLKDFKGAQKALEDYLREGKHPVARKALAFIHYDADELEKAKKYAEEGLRQTEDADLRRLYERIQREEKGRGHSVSESTTHFTAVFDGYTQSSISRLVLGVLEDAYSKVGSEVGYFPSEPVTVILYGNKDFYEVTQKPDWAGGLYDGKIRVPVRGAETNKAALKQILFHEYTHALVHAITSECPVWINEGLAEYFSRPYSSYNEASIGQVIPLRNLERSFLEVPGIPVETAYLESYSAVKYLVGRYGMFKMKIFLEKLGTGTPLNTAFSDAFYQSYDEFVASWGK